jgi:hypothetical protein
MGQSLQRLCRDEAGGCTVVAVVSRKVGAWSSMASRNSPRRLSGVPEFDVAVDFSLPEGFDAILSLWRRGVRRSYPGPPDCRARRKRHWPPRRPASR